MVDMVGYSCYYFDCIYYLVLFYKNKILSKIFIKYKILNMIMPIIKDVSAREILDSRGNPTVEVKVKSENFEAVASCPSGASVGKYESFEVRDMGVRYDGFGVRKAVYNVNKIISPNLVNHELDLKFIDTLMCELDGTENKSRLGVNSILPVSMAFYRLKALELNKPLYSLLGNKKILPLLFMNLLNGGKHANNGVAFQEYMVVPKYKSFEDSLRIGTEIYHALGREVNKKYKSYGVGDEGGYAPKLKTVEDGFILLSEVIASLELLDYYNRLIKNYKIISIEDPFEQDDFETFSLLKKVQVVGDDLTVSHIDRVKKALNHKSINCLLLKMNQVGTVTESLEVAKLAMKKIKVMVSHRSGETNDSFISDLAVGLGCGMIKAGAPCRSERLSKYNRLSEMNLKRFGL